MTTTDKHRWQFAGRFRRSAFGWRSQPAIQRVREAVSEIKRAACRDPILGAEGAVLFLEKMSAALEYVDSSSGAIATAVNHAISELVSIIATAPVDLGGRAKWLIVGRFNVLAEDILNGLKQRMADRATQSSLGNIRVQSAGRDLETRRKLR